MEISAKEFALLAIQAHLAGQLLENPDNAPGNIEKAKEYALSLFESSKDSCNAGEAQKECYECKFKGSFPGSAHSTCSNPDPNMTGDAHGIKNGWFMYPINFDPTWKTKHCSNFEKK